MAFKLILALAIKNGLKTTDVFNQYVDIATLGTIADVVPLLGENRVIVDKGLKFCTIQKNRHSCNNGSCRCFG